MALLFFFIMVVGHKGVGVMSGFLGKLKREREGERRCKEGEEKPASSASMHYGKKKIHSLQNPFGLYFVNSE